MRKWPVAKMSPSTSPRPDDRRVVGRAGPQAGDRALELELGDVGKRPVGLAQKLEDAARRDPGVEAHLLHGRAGDQAPVGPRHEIDPLGDDDPPAAGASAGAPRRVRI